MLYMHIPCYSLPCMQILQAETAWGAATDKAETNTVGHF